MTMELSFLLSYLYSIAECFCYVINSIFKDMDSATVFLLTFGGTVILCGIFSFLSDPEYTLRERVRTAVFTFVKSLPPVKARIDAKRAETMDSLRLAYGTGAHAGNAPIRELPDKSMTRLDILSTALDYKAASANWSNGTVSGAVYHGGRELTALSAQIYKEFAWTNPLHPEIFSDVRRMEAEIISICCRLFNGDESVCGCTTSGGTESIIMATLAYRTLAYERGIRYPEIVMPATAHAAFDKAAHYLRMRIVRCDTLPSGEVDVTAMRRAINRRTCMLVGSCPSYSHGIIDPIVEIGKLGQSRGIPVHVDACLGGFLLPFLDRAGYPLGSPVDFRVPGVTSISCDTHKYAFAPKGSSVLLYRNAEYRRRQFFSTTTWCGGFYASPTMPGSRPGAVLAACWATLLYFGVEGYVDATRQILATARKIKAGLASIPGVKVMGDPQLSVIGVGSDVFSAWRLSDALKLKGWKLNALQKPASFHICCTHLHTQAGVAERLLEDIREAAEVLMRSPNEKDTGIGEIYGTAQKIPDTDLVDDLALSFIDILLSV